MSPANLFDFVSAFLPWDDWIFRVVGGLIVALSCLSVALTWSAWRKGQWLRGYAKDLRQYKKPISEADLGKIEEGLTKRCKWLTDKWKEFREGLVSRPQIGFCNAIAIDALVEDEAHLSSVRGKGIPIGFGLGERLPGLCTGLGVLGTFVGLTTGLASVETGTAAEISDNVMQLIASLQSAFATSIFGVFASVVLTVLLGSARDALLSATTDFREAIDDLFVRVTPEALLEEHGGLLRGMRDDLEESRTCLQEISNNLADKIGHGFASTVEKLLVPSLTEMSSAVRDQVATAAETSQAGTRQFVEEAVGQISGALQGSFGAMERSIGEFSREFERIASTVGDVVRQAGDATAQQQQVLRQGEAALLAASNRSAEVEEQLASVSQSTAAVAELAQVLHRNAVASTQLQERQAQLHEAVQGQVQAVSGTVSETASVFATSSSELQAVARALAPLVQQLGHSVAGLTSGAERASAAVVDSSRSLADRSVDEVRLVADFRDASSAFATALRQADPALRSFQQASVSLTAQQKELGTAAVALDASALALGRTSAKVEETTRTFSDALADAANQVRAVQAETSEWADGTTRAIEMFAAGLNAALSQSLSTYDESLAKAVVALQSGVSQLQEVVDGIEPIADGVRRVQNRPVESV
ncbi:MAG: hypothetical protein V3V08_02605 [Nannocystaceae bacterium]